ncbi:unnamed protein product [Pleuronectes platessa]|uniref:Uncharacterized protein n=1 Tax=Pleuronectes platessa TaxID=8262 RepID=A0A9N7TYQ1_PLEPL|nr:unnamed protein product [Pleuronectes platessa]
MFVLNLKLSSRVPTSLRRRSLVQIPLNLKLLHFKVQFIIECSCGASPLTPPQEADVSEPLPLTCSSSGFGLTGFEQSHNSAQCYPCHGNPKSLMTMESSARSHDTKKKR